MEENLLLKQPADPRLICRTSDLPDVPPGTEMDDYDAKKIEKETTSKKPSRRSSPSPKRKSPPPSRSRRSPSPARRNRYRYSPERRGSRFDRRRSPPRDRYRGRGGRRGHSSSRSRSRSVSPTNRRSGRSRWSPKKKPKTPTPPPMQLTMPGIEANKMMMTTAPPPSAGQFGVMQAPPPPQMYGAEAYAGYGQTYPPFGQQPNAYAGSYNAAYGGQNNWTGHNAYPQQGWIQNSVPNANPMPQTQTQETSSFSNNNVNNQAHNVPSGTSDPSAHDAAVAQEAENQRDELKKQRSSYIQKNSVLKKELKMLKDQRKDLDSGTAPPSPTTKGFIDENEKLQSQIIKKIATIDNVIEMLTGVIGEEHVEQGNSAGSEVGIQNSNSAQKTEGISQLDPRLARKAQQKRTTSTSSNSSDGSHTSDSSSSSSSESSSSTENDEEDVKQKPNNKPSNSGKSSVSTKQADDDDDSSPERLKHKVMESMKSKQRTLSATALKDFPSLAEKIKTVVEPEPVRFNYAFYDPEMHWCQKCDVFPKTAKDYLKHLHSKEHMEKENASETPWHANLVEDNFPTYENVQTKRMPIRGITFFAPATAWYCKLCSTWMGDLHCASVHLKSRQHSSKYTAFLERNPNFEMNWLADRQRVLNEKSFEAAASQITAVSTTAAEEREIKKNKKIDEKSSKKHKKNADKKNKKKKKKQKKRKKAQDSSTDSSNSESSSSEDVEEKHAKKKKKIQKILSPIKDLDNPNPAASIRLAMRKTESNVVEVDDDEQPPPPPPISMTIASTNTKRPLGNWTLAQEGTGKPTDQVSAKSDNKSDDTIIQQWNSVQPVISDNEKKLLEQLKGKLKTPKAMDSSAKDLKDSKDNDRFDGTKNRESRLERSYRGKRSRTRSPTRSRSRGRDWRRARSRSLRRRSRSRGRRSRSRSRGRYSPVRGGRRRYSRSRSRRRRSRSRSRNRRGRRSRTRSRSGSRSGRGSPSAALTSASRIEKPVIPHSEFRPRVPEKDKEKEKKLNESKDKKDSKKPAKPASSAAASGKKLPFIGKMPVFKKQATGQSEVEVTEAASTTTPTDATTTVASGGFVTQTTAAVAPPRPPAPTAEQIKMAMMEDVYGNAPPFHPDVNVMHSGMDYEDLMPDPVQFVNLMSQAPPAPPPPIEDANDEIDMLPPGIDENEMENEEFVAKPAPESGEGDAALPRDFEEALNIIFPGERKSGDDDDENSQAGREPSGETQIIVEQPVMQMDELFKDGIHMVSIEETSLIAMDEASQLSMNEPLVFNNSANKAVNKNAAAENDVGKVFTDEPLPKPDHNSDDKENMLSAASNNEPVVAVADNKTETTEQSDKTVQPATPVGTDSIPMPPPATETQDIDCPAADLNLDDIPHPPAPLSESEKQRRQEELDDLAMLGIDADDMAAQCM